MPEWTNKHPRKRRYAILLFDRFSNHCFANTLEPLRAANGFVSEPAYEWSVHTVTGDVVTSSSGVRILPDAALDRAISGEALILMPSYDWRAHATPATLRAIRAAAGRFGAIMGFDTGSWLMAEAGLLDNRRATIHFDELDAFAEAFPDIDVRRERWVEDGDRITAGGAAIACDLMLCLIGRHLGMAVATGVASLLMTGAGAGAEAERYGGADRAIGGDVRVARAIAGMSAHIEHPLTVGMLASYAGCTRRQLENRFRRALGATPRQVYQRLRLDAGRRLIGGSSMSIAEVATRCGYENSSAFTRAFRRTFGKPPRAMRN